MTRLEMQPGHYGQISCSMEANGVWVARARYRRVDGERGRTKASGANKDLATGALKAKLVTLLSETHRGGALLTPNSTFAELACTWADYVDEMRIGADGTRHEGRRLITARIIPGLGHLKLRAIGPLDVSNWYLAESARTPSQANNALSIVRRIGQHGLMLQVLTLNPCGGITRRRKTPEEQEAESDVFAPGPEELDFFRKTMRDYRERPGRMGPKPSLLALDVVEVMLGSGARTGEAMGLQWSSIDLQFERPTVLMGLLRV